MIPTKTQMLHQTLGQITTLTMVISNVDIMHSTTTPITGTSVTTLTTTILITGTHETIPINTIPTTTGTHQDQEG